MLSRFGDIDSEEEIQVDQRNSVLNSKKGLLVRQTFAKYI